MSIGALFLKLSHAIQLIFLLFITHSQVWLYTKICRKSCEYDVNLDHTRIISFDCLKKWLFGNELQSRWNGKLSMKLVEKWLMEFTLSNLEIISCEKKLVHIAVHGEQINRSKGRIFDTVSPHYCFSLYYPMPLNK